jgi:hypothetical protein
MLCWQGEGKPRPYMYALFALILSPGKRAIQILTPGRV